MKFNFEKKLQDWTAFYQKHDISLPSDFSKVMRDIWERSSDAIEKAIKEKGFDMFLFIPESVDKMDIKKLGEKMTEVYREEKGNDTYWGGRTENIINARKGNRIVLIHSSSDLTANLELKKTLDRKFGGEKTDGVDNRAGDFVKQGEELTLPEWLVLQRQVWEATGTHIDGKLTPDGDYIICTWIPGSRAGSDVFRVDWRPDGSQVVINTLWSEDSSPAIGCRLSRCFS